MSFNICSITFNIGFLVKNIKSDNAYLILSMNLIVKIAS